MFSLIQFDANDPQGLMRRKHQTNHRRLGNGVLSGGLANVGLTSKLKSAALENPLQSVK